MDMLKVHYGSKLILEFIQENMQDFKPEEKIAVLRATADTINDVIGAEALLEMYKNMFRR